MLLTIDIGNTNMVFGIFKGEEMLGSFRLSTNSTATSDEVGIMAVSYFERFGYRAEDLKACIIGSVVPQVMYSVTSAVIKYFGVEPLVVGTDVDAGLKFDRRCYETGRLGTDRAVNCTAAIKKYGGPFVILDFGTATTIDALARTAPIWAAPLAGPAGQSGCAGSPGQPCCREWSCKCPRRFLAETRWSRSRLAWWLGMWAIWNT